jgi:DnaJ-class molecular chaperone
MPFCNRCGKPNLQDASFCSYCGSQIGMPQARFEATYSFETAPTYKVVQLRHEYCEGTGIDFHNGPMGIRCRTCGGEGALSIRIGSADSLSECQECGGSGVNQNISMMGIECKKCHGTGKIAQKILTY